MKRDDLLALTSDDLITLTNRGTVKRAARELESEALSCEFEEQENGQLCARWSDGIVCEFPAGAALEDAVCSSGTVGISRHVVRAVLAYQQHVGAQQQQPAEQSAWNPGDITDEQLNKHFRSAAVTRARTRFSVGVLVELVRGHKPLARFLSEPCTVRFMVPGDLRYVYADCAERLLSTYVPMAVWAFRELPEDQTAGLVSIQIEKLPVPADLLGEARRSVADLCEHGVTGCNYAWRDRLTRLEGRCRDAGLVWPAEIMAELVLQYQRYHEHDARFDPREVVQLAGELIIRCHAIQADTGAVPQLLVRGAKSDTLTEIRSARFVGLGCGARVGPHSVQLTAFHQDVSSGTVVGIPREYKDPEPESGEEPSDFSQLAKRSITRGLSMSALAAGQMLLKSGKRAPSHRLTLPRGQVSVIPQAYEWENLRAPVLAEGIAEMAARLQGLPPSALRPRRLTEDLHVCPLREVKSVDFDVAAQRLVAAVQDVHGDVAYLVHPYASRGRQGFESLAAHLNKHQSEIRFVSGHVHLGHAGLEIHPLCVVFEAGARRIAIQPWVDNWDGSSAELAGAEETDAAGSPIASIRKQLVQLLSETMTTGLRRANHDVLALWKDIVRDCGEVGFVELTSLTTEIADAIQKKSETRAFDVAPCLHLLNQILIWSRLAEDVT